MNLFVNVLCNIQGFNKNMSYQVWKIESWEAGDSVTTEFLLSNDYGKFCWVNANNCRRFIAKETRRRHLNFE